MIFIVSTFVEAKSAEEALKKAKRMPVTEVSVHSGSWEKQNFSLTDEPVKKLGFTEKNGK